MTPTTKERLLKLDGLVVGAISAACLSAQSLEWDLNQYLAGGVDQYDRLRVLPKHLTPGTPDEARSTLCALAQQPKDVQPLMVFLATSGYTLDAATGARVGEIINFFVETFDGHLLVHIADLDRTGEVARLNWRDVITSFDQKGISNGGKLSNFYGLRREDE